MRRAALLVAIVVWAGPAGAGENWPQFLGPTCDGQSDATRAPLTWSETKNVTWKTPIHGRGWSSPVVWGDQVWMTTAPKNGKELFAVCVHRLTGKILHDIKLFDVSKPQRIAALNSYASPTPAVEAGRVYVHFGTYGTACLETRTGKTLWVRRDLHCDHHVGPGSSVLLMGRLVVLTLDGMDAQYLVALDKTTGKTVWKTNRSTDFGNLRGEFRKAFCTPIVIGAGGRRQLISPGAEAAIAYDPDTGKELWKVRYKGGYSNVPRPLPAAGLVLINGGGWHPWLLAIRPGGRGDVTETHVAWKMTADVPMVASPVVVDAPRVPAAAEGGGVPLVYLVTDKGVLSCVEAKTGRRVWRRRLGGRFSASPLVAAGRIYFFDDKGKATVIAPGREYKELAVNRLDNGCMASPAVVGDALFVRTKTHLYRIEEQASAPPAPGSSKAAN